MKLTAHDWSALSALLDEAMALPAEELPSWLDSLPPQARTYRATLSRLLLHASGPQTRDFLNALPGLDAVDEASGDRAAEAVGAQVGVYRLLREIGRGGMGTVWLAQRNDGVLEHEVALKLPHPGVAAGRFAERLVRERDILASLAHPNIARLLDAGVTAGGQPFIALEFVQGRTLIDHCDARCLGLRERIALFQQILGAVQYAHAHLVIHRDLKPSNVLVDEQGQVRLLDFGIAKLMVEGRAEATELTLDAGRVLTPDFASPEQISGGAITTASDIYSLGVLLYELLTGRRPYALRRQSAAALEEAILAADLRRPSDAALDEAGARARGLSRARLARMLRGDLDAIVLKALRPRPSDRFPTAEEFRQDLRRYLDGEAVQARPVGQLYRTGKFVRRHRVAVAAAAAVCLSLGAGIAATAFMAREATQQAARAKAIKEFVIGLFKQTDPASTRGHALTALEMLDRGQRDLQATLHDQPELVAELDAVLVDLYDKLGEEKKALPLAERRCALTLALDGPRSLAYGDALASLADLYLSTNLDQKAYETYQQARAILQAHSSQRAADLLVIDGHVAFLLARMKRYAESEAVTRALIPKLAARFGPHSWEVIRNEAHLASALAAQGDTAQALAIHRTISPWLDALDPALQPAAQEVRFGMGYVQLKAHDYAGAEATFRRFVADSDRLRGADNHDSLVARQALVAVLVAQGRYGEAAPLIDTAIAVAQRTLGEDDVMTRQDLSTGAMLAVAGRTAEAESLTRRSLQHLERVTGLTPQRGWAFERRLALALIFNGKATEADAVLHRVEAEERAAPQTRDDGSRGTTLFYRAGAELALGRAQEAARTAAQAAQAFGQASDSAADAARARLTQALALARAGQAQPAQDTLAQAETALHALLPPDHPDFAWAQLVRAEVLRATGQTEEASRLEPDARARLARLGIVLPPVLPLVL